MEVLFAHLGRRVAAGQAADAWATLLGAFEAHLLAVPRSKFTQYALWFLADKARSRPCIPGAGAWVRLGVAGSIVKCRRQVVCCYLSRAA